MLALVLDEPHTAKARDHLDRWVEDGTALHAPLLAQYEVASSLARKRGRREMSREETDEALAIIGAMRVTYDLAPDNARAVEVAVDLHRHSAYDAAYLALAERIDGEVWTLDGPLARNAAGRYRVSLID